MRLSVIIPWRDSGDEWRYRSMEWICARYAALMPDCELILGDSASHLPFNRSAARNNAFKKASGDVLLLADSDTVFQLPQIEKGIAALLAGAPWVIPYSEGRYYNLSSDETALAWRCSPDAGIPEPSDASQWEHKITSWAGLILLPRAAFEAVGGYDEDFELWGFEDSAFKAALDNVVGAHRRTDGYALHLWHPAPEADCFGNPQIDKNRALYRMYEAGLLP